MGKGRGERFKLTVRGTGRKRVEQVLADLCADPQTSGGLLAAVPEEAAGPLLERLRVHAPCSAVVGRVEARSGPELVLE